MHVQTAVVYGGVPFANSQDEVKRTAPNILVGTPGRLQHLLQNEIICLSSVKRLIIDECDLMLDEYDFRKSIQQILKRTPRQKQTMLFSATIKEELKSLCRRFTRRERTEEIYVVTWLTKLLFEHQRGRKKDEIS